VAVVREIQPLVGAGLAVARASAELAVRLVDAGSWHSTSPARSQDARRGLGALLERALTQSTGDAQRALRESVTQGLVPDEARIIAGLAAREWSAAVHVEARRDEDLHLGLRNASLIGRQSGVGLVTRTPFYVGRLLSRGLVELTPEHPDRKEDYEVLLAEPDVLDAVRQAGRGPLGARIRRYGLVLSALGNDVWAAGTLEPPT
jgi:hypothetical protein